MSSGYEVALRIRKQHRSLAESSVMADEDKKLWNRVWGLRVKKKVQHFLWRCINNSLPVLHNLKRRGIKCSGACQQCGETDETVEHLMFECQNSATTWKLSPVCWDGLQAYSNNLKHWWTVLAKAGMESRMVERLEITAYLCWNL